MKPYSWTAALEYILLNYFMSVNAIEKTVPKQTLNVSVGSLLSQFSSNQANMILTLIEIFIRTQNQNIWNETMNLVKFTIILILPYSEGKFFPRHIVKYESNYMSFIIIIIIRCYFNSRVVWEAFARGIHGSCFVTRQAASNEKKCFTSISVETKSVHWQRTWNLWQCNGHLWMITILGCPCIWWVDFYWIQIKNIRAFLRTNFLN